MKRISAFLLAAALCASLLAGCGKPAAEPSSSEELPEIVGTVEQLTVLLPYGAGEGVLEAHRAGFVSALRTALRQEGWQVENVAVSIAATQAASGKALDDGTADIVILPASRYFTFAEDAILLMTATQPGVSVNTTRPADWNGSVEAPAYTDEDCPYGRTLICATKSAAGRKLAQAAADGTLTWEDLSAAQWMYPTASTSSDFFYPDLWLQKTFEKTMEDLPDAVAVDGYGALFAEAGGDGADVIVLAADRRIDYEAAWMRSKDEMDHTGKMGLGHDDSIFNDIQVIGVTEPIYGDVMALRREDGELSEEPFRRALMAAIKTLEADADTRAIWESCGYTGFTDGSESNYDNIRDLTVFGAGD